MPFSPFLAGQDLTAALLNTAIDNAHGVKALTSDLTTSATTFTDSSELTVAVAANAAYIITCQIIFDASTTADINIRLTAPTGTLLRMAPWGQSAATVDNVPQTVTDATATWTQSYGGKGAGTYCLVRPAGMISVNTASGNLVMGFAQVSASGSTLLKVGTMFALSRIF
jgi:hypothetical protein